MRRRDGKGSPSPLSDCHLFFIPAANETRNKRIKEESEEQKRPIPIEVRTSSQRLLVLLRYLSQPLNITRQIMTILSFSNLQILQEDGTTSIDSLFVDQTTGLIVEKPDGLVEVEEVQLQQSEDLLLSGGSLNYCPVIF